MKKQMITKQEIIGENTNIKGTEKIETIYPESIVLPSYEYGNSQDSLDAGLALRNLSSGGLKLGSFTITGTGNKSITGVGFAPKIVKLTSYSQTGNTGEVGLGIMTSTQQNCINITNSVAVTAECIYYGNPVKARAAYVSMDSDGFTINCTYFANTTYVLYECYS